MLTYKCKYCGEEKAASSKMRMTCFDCKVKKNRERYTKKPPEQKVRQGDMTQREWLDWQHKLRHAENN